MLIGSFETVARPLIKSQFAPIEWSAMSSHPRVRYRDVPGAEEILTREFLDFLARLNDAMRGQIAAVRTAQAERLQRALRHHAPPAALPPSEATLEPWQVPALPTPLTLPGI